MACGCSQQKKTTVYVLSYDDGRKGGEHATRTDAVMADARNGGGGTIRAVQK